MVVRFSAELWQHDGEGGWHFVTLPPDAGDDVRDGAGARTGFGSVRVRATLGATSWETSVFPSSKDASYLLPVKKAVRRAEGLEPGDAVEVALELL